MRSLQGRQLSKRGDACVMASLWGSSGSNIHFSSTAGCRDNHRVLSRCNYISKVKQGLKDACSRGYDKWFAHLEKEFVQNIPPDGEIQTTDAPGSCHFLHTHTYTHTEPNWICFGLCLHISDLKHNTKPTGIHLISCVFWNKKVLHFVFFKPLLEQHPERFVSQEVLLLQLK